MLWYCRDITTYDRIMFIKKGKEEKCGRILY